MIRLDLASEAWDQDKVGNCPQLCDTWPMCRACPGFHLTSKLSEIKMFVSSTLKRVQVSGEASVLCLQQPPLPQEESLAS